MVTSRFYAAHAILDPATDDAWSPQRLQQHRAALTTAVGRLVAPSPHPQPYDADLEKIETRRRPADQGTTRTAQHG
jgi:hypothetical protein